MKHAFSNRFIRQYHALSAGRKAKFDKQLGHLLRSFRNNRGQKPHLLEKVVIGPEGGEADSLKSAAEENPSSILARMETIGGFTDPGPRDPPAGVFTCRQDPNPVHFGICAPHRLTQASDFHPTVSFAADLRRQMAVRSDDRHFR